MEQKILIPMAYKRQLQKPLLIITITDGEPSENPKNKVVQVIQECRRRLAGQYGPKAVAFQFAQVRRPGGGLGRRGILRGTSGSLCSTCAVQPGACEHCQPSALTWQLFVSGGRSHTIRPTLFQLCDG
jgi:hypothetical protein